MFGSSVPKQVIRRQEDRPLSRLLSTSDVAKVLGLTRHGVRWLVQQGDLTCERMRSGQWVFHNGDVQRCELRRGEARSRRRADVLASLHLRMVKAGIEPVQLSFFSGPGLRIVARGERALRDCVANAADSRRVSRGSEKLPSVNRKAASR